MNFGRRVPATFGLHDPAALAGALGLALNELPTQAQALEAMAASTDEASAHAALLLDDVARAQHLLEHPFIPGDDRPFVMTSRERRRLVRDVLEHEGAEATKMVLRGWRDHTVNALGVA